jgi:hypothetical protein
MNVNEVPQDPRNIKPGDTLKKVVYAVDTDGKYTGVNSAGWEPENVAMKQAGEEIDENLAATEQQVRAGTLSPIPWFMLKNLMDVALLANYAGKWQWQVKRHFKPAVFKTLNNAMLDKYAQIFNITTDELVNFGKEKQRS